LVLFVGLFFGFVFVLVLVLFVGLFFGRGLET